MKSTVRLIGAGCVAALALGGCSDMAQPGDPNYRSQQGAIAGAAIGGLFGLTRPGKDSVLKGAVGAGIGAAIGGALGHELDRQAGALRGAVRDDRIVITNTGEALLVTMPNDILFATDSAVVSPALRADLVALADHLNRFPGSDVEVIGHTDNDGGAAYNQALSERRANSVAAVLMDNGVAPYRIVATGRGEDSPVASNLTADGKALNRRVEVVIRPRA